MSARALAGTALTLLISTIVFAQMAMTSQASSATSPSQTPGIEVRGRLLKRTFTDYTVMLFAPTGEPWLASWNDADQIAVFENPTNRAVITAQYLKFPLDLTLKAAAGNRDAFMDNALRKYCAVQLARSHDSAIASQPIDIQGRTTGDHFFRFCQITGRDQNGGRHGFFFILLRGSASNPEFNGDTLVLTIGFPNGIADAQRQSALKVFDIVLQNISFY
jgi:hypothetical protein